MSKLKLSICIIAGTIALAGCQTSRTGGSQGGLNLTPAPETPAKPADPGNINGKWVPTNASAQSVYYNQFKNGKFVSRSPDGKKTIAAGSYKSTSDGGIQMNWYSEARKSNASATCKKLTSSELQCTSGGSVFNLKRA